MINNPKRRRPALRVSIFRVGLKWGARISRSDLSKHVGTFTSTRYIYPKLADVIAAIEEHALRLDQDAPDR